MSISLANTNLFLDHICRGYARALGTSAGYGIGESGDTDRVAGAMADLNAAILATADSTVIAGTSSIPGILLDLVNFQNSMSAVKVACPRTVLSRIERQHRALALTGVASLDQYLTYYNYGSGGTNTALQSPYFRKLFYQWKGSYPTLRNLYFEMKAGTVFEGATYTNALRKLLVGTGETAGTAIDTAKYAGGVPYLTVSGFAGTAGTVTVTGTQYDPATGTFTATKTWTVSVTGSGTFALASGGGNAASANALIVAVSGISAAGSITASTTIYAEAWRPQTAGRLTIPA